MDLNTLLLLLAGLFLLVVGAEALVRGASQLATFLGITPLVIGLTVVAYGTSSPEFAVTVQATWTGQTSLAIGNVVGSNIFNVLFILGLSSLLVPLTVAQQLVRWDVPLMIGVSLLLWWLAADQRLTRLECASLAAGAIGYTAILIWSSRRESARIKKEYAESFAEPLPPPPSALVAVMLVFGGLAMLVLGSRWLVAGATQLARQFEISETVIGLTIVAAGTSLPEVATSVMAGLRGQRDIAVGNAVGSNLFNILGVLGFAGVLAPSELLVPESVLAFDIPIMTAVAAACLPIFFTGYSIARWEGAVFLGYYVAYTCYLILAAQQHARLPLFSSVMLWFVIPITVITLLALALAAARRDRRRA